MNIGRVIGNLFKWSNLHLCRELVLEGGREGGREGGLIPIQESTRGRTAAAVGCEEDFSLTPKSHTESVPG